MFSDEGKLLKSVVNSVLGTMKKVPLEVAKHPVAMDEIVQDFERIGGKSIQSEEHVQIVGIVGFGGSGKTTLATELYNRKNSFFNRSSFLHDVRDAASKNVLHTKQKKLLEDLRIQNLKSFDNVKEGKGILADRLKTLYVLIVVDDVDHEDQLDALLPPKESLGSGSLVIVTTREGRVLAKCGITSIYAMQPLQHFHAKQLFCWHAFLQPSPQKGFDELVEIFLKICSGLPLSLKVIGGQLYGRKSMEYWYALLDKIRRTLPEDIIAILKVSFDALDRDEQNVFLDIACFFIGEERSLAIPVWDGSGWSGLCSLETLLNKCLVEVDKKGRIRMHDYLRDLGREIATTSSPSRFWSHRQRQNIQRGIPIRGIITIPGSMEYYCPFPFEEFMEMMRMSNVRVGLQLLLVQGNEFTQQCRKLSRGLLWLRWSYFYHGCIPSWLSLENIRVLQLLHAERLEALWEDAHPPLQLRELLIEDAPYLQSLPRSIGHLKHLKRLSVVGSSTFLNSVLMILPLEFCRLHWLEHLDLEKCNKLSSLPNHFGDLINLRHINLSGCNSLQMLPDSFKRLIHLEYLNLSGCSKLVLQSNILENITNLKVFDVSGCCQLQILPHNITNQASLGELHLRDSTSLRNLPSSVGQLGKLKRLDLRNTSNLRELPTSIGELSNLKRLDLGYTSSLMELPASIGQLNKLKELEISGCRLLTRLPSSLGNLSSLVTLTVSGCDKLESLPIDTRQLYSLQTLTIQRCPELYEMPSLAGLVSLNKLHVVDCHKIKKIESLLHLTSLEKLFVRTCWMVPGIHSLEGPERLRTLNLEAENISAFDPCIQSMEIEKWPWEMTICARMFPRVQSILNSFTFPGLAVYNSLRSHSDFSHYEGDDYYTESLKWSLTCWETNLSEAAIACYLVRFVNSYDRDVSLVIEGGESSSVELREGEWIVICVFREVSHLLKGRRLLLQASTPDSYDVNEANIYHGWLMVGERGSVVEGFKQLFETLCKATSIT